MRNFGLILLALCALVPGAAQQSAPQPLLGFFPTPARPTWRDMLATLEGISRHADAVLLQRNVPWQDFAAGPDATSREFENLQNLVRLSRQRGLEPIFVVDALNGLDRRRFYGLPPAWGRVGFADRRVRRAFTNFAVRIAREFHPRYLGLGSEVNTYMAAHPADAANLVSLYRETYAAVKQASPATLVFATFQWDQLRRGRTGVDWSSIEAFEPLLDVWAISSYPCFDYPQGPPADYYTPLPARTSKPLAVAEGGCSSKRVGRWPGSAAAQTAYLRAIRDQLGPRLAFWIYLLYNDVDANAYHSAVASERDQETLALFASMGLTDAAGRPKAALAFWDAVRRKARKSPPAPAKAK